MSSPSPEPAALLFVRILLVVLVVLPALAVPGIAAALAIKLLADAAVYIFGG